MAPAIKYNATAARERQHLGMAQHIANHESPRTTRLYDRRVEEISLDEIERVDL